MCVQAPQYKHVIKHALYGQGEWKQKHKDPIDSGAVVTLSVFSRFTTVSLRSSYVKWIFFSADMLHQLRDII